MAPPIPPRLTADHAVLFDDEEQLALSRRDFLGRGALMVAPDGDLVPLSTITVTARGGALGAEVELSCQVVSMQPGRALLQIEGDVPALLLQPKPINPFARPAPASDDKPVNPFAKPAPADDDKPVNPFAKPAPTDDGKPVNPFAKPAPADDDKPVNPFAKPAPADDDKPVNPFAKPTSAGDGPSSSAATASAAGVPSLVRGALLRFATSADLKRAADALQLHGVVLARAVDDDAPQRALRLALGTRIDADTLEVDVKPHSSGACVITFAELAGVAGAVERLLELAETAAASPAPAPASTSPPPVVPAEAPFDEAPPPPPPGKLEAPFAPPPGGTPPPPAAAAPLAWEDSADLGSGLMPPPSTSSASDDISDDTPLAAPAEPAEPAVTDDIPLAAPAESLVTDDIPLAAPAEPVVTDEPADDAVAEHKGSEPFLDGDRLLLADKAAVDRWRSDLDTLGAAQVTAADSTQLPERIEIVVVDGAPLGPFEVQALPAGDAVVLQPVDAAAVLAALDAPSPPADAEPRAEHTTDEPAAVDAAQEAEAANPPASPAADPPTRAPSAPPTLEDDRLFFGTVADVAGALKDLSDVGALLARCSRPMAGERTITVIVASGGDAGTHKASLQPMGGDQVLMQFADASALSEALAVLTKAAGKGTADHKPPPPARQPVPPTLEGSVLYFETPQDLDHAAADLIQHGATLARCASPSSLSPALSVVFAIGEGRGPDTLKATAQPAGVEQVVLQFEDRAALPQALARVPRDRPAAAAGGSGKGFALAGPYVVPSTAAEILGIPLSRPPTDAEVERPTLPLLIRGLTTRPGSWRLTMEPEGHAQGFVVLRGQKTASAPKPFSDVGRAAAKASGRYKVTPLKDNNPLSWDGSLLDLMVQLLSGIVGNFDYDELNDGLGDRALMAPRLNAQGEKLLPALPFTGGQERMIRRRMDGRTRVDEVVNGPGGQRAGWEAIYILETFGCLDWGPVDKQANVKKTVRLTTAELALADLADKDYFTRLGLHWSCAPRKIKPAYEAAHEKFKPGSPAAKEDPVNANKMHELVEEAYATLTDPGKRKAYRKATFSLVWSQHADLMVSHAKLALYRGDVHDARDTLEGIADFYKHPEAGSLLKKLRQKIEDGG
jgi:hypothetical protein